MNRYQKLFTHLTHNKLGAFVPFITLGDPNPIYFTHIVDILISSGSDALEIGIPFSDPISDGPTIQKSMTRALQSNINFPHCLTMIRDIRCKYPNLPIGLLIYANLVFKNGINNFYAYCAELDIDSVLIPDIPIEESFPFYSVSKRYKIAHIFICPPNATKDLINKIVYHGSGYIYFLSRPGVTGIDNNKTTINITTLNTLIQCIRIQKKLLPILQGFGIHTPLQAYESLSLGTSGIISGSVIVNIIEEHISNLEIMLKTLKNLVCSMKRSMSFNHT